MSLVKNPGEKSDNMFGYKTLVSIKAHSSNFEMFMQLMEWASSKLAINDLAG